MHPSAIDVLRRVFGYSEFRGAQESIISRVSAGGDALVLMPTGGGKSLCYQIPALLRPGAAVVVSPLIALMEDQVQALQQNGVRAAVINSTLDARTARERERALTDGELDLVYVAPERLTTESFLSVLDRSELALFAIDEAHCVSQWGHDFRPEYRKLDVLAERFPGVPRIALTATADPRTREEIVTHLGLSPEDVFVSSFDRPNLRYTVVAKDGPKSQLLELIRSRHRGESGIVYCMSRKKVDQTAEWLRGQGITALAYHAGLDAAMRKAHQESFLREPAVVMVATIAFGMGIDKPDVRFVAHLDLPRSIEAYYQETGRAGRDGLPADAWMCYGYQDAVLLRQGVERSESPAERKRIEHGQLSALLGYCESATCRRLVLLEHFGERYEPPCDSCDTCLHPVDTYDGTTVAQKALSNVYRTGQRFGATYLASVLLGEDDERMRRNRHDQISTYGIGGELDKRGWMSLYRQLVAAGLLVVDGEHGGLALSERARSVLKGEETFRARKDPGPGKSAKKASRAADQTLESEDDRALFEALRERRLSLAREQGVPPYVIFHDRTLVEMARARPASTDELATIGGVGAAKLERYGASFLEVLHAHSEPPTDAHDSGD